MRIHRIVVSAAAIAAAVLASAPSLAAPPFVDRSVTLPRHDWAFDLGLGIAHESPPNPRRSFTGPGMNLEMGVGVTDRFEIGVRTGLRMNDDARSTHADEYGRLFDRQTFGTGFETMANPELRFRGALAKHDVAEVGIEGRAIVPFEHNTGFAMQFGLPLLFHIGHSVRLDTGVFVPVVFGDNLNNQNTQWALSAPLDVWIQATDKLWLGPMTGLKFHHYAPNNDGTDFQLGFGLGYQFTRIVDFKSMFYMPVVNNNDNVQAFGVGAGVQIRIE